MKLIFVLNHCKEVCKNIWKNSNIGKQQIPQLGTNITIMIKKCTNINLTSLFKSLGNRTLDFGIYMLLTKLKCSYHRMSISLSN